MTKNEFIKRYNEVTGDIVLNYFYSCEILKDISPSCMNYYHVYLGDIRRSWKRTSLNEDGWSCSIYGFNQIDRMFAMELFFHACLAEKWYKKF